METGGAPISFVLAGAAPGGVGTRAAPFARVADALAVAPAGSFVAVGAGTYAESLSVPGGVTIVGACAERTIIVAPAGSGHGLEILSGEVGLRGLQLRGPGIAVFVANPGTRVELDGVLMDSSAELGLEAQRGAEVVARALVIRRRGAFGVLVDAGAHVVLERAVFEEIAGDSAHVIDPGSSLALRGVAIRDALPGSDGFGRGVVVSQGADLELAGVTVERAHGVAVAWMDGGRGVASDLHVRGAATSLDGQGGNGLYFGPGSRAVLARASVEDTTFAAVLSAGVATTSTLTDLVVRSAGSESSGVEVRGGARVELGRALVEQPQYHGLGAFDAASHLVARDVVVRRGLVRSRAPAMGVELYPGARLELERASISHFTGSGVRLATATASLRDVVVRDVGEPGSDVDVGDGIFAVTTDLVAERVLVERARTSGFSLHFELDATIDDLTIRSVGPGRVQREDGFGLVCTTGCRLHGARISVADTRKGGVAAQAGADLTLEDLEVTDTAVEEASGIVGNGLALSESKMHLLRAAIRRSAEDGIYANLVELDAIDLLIESPRRDGLSADKGGLTRLLRAHVAGFGACGYNLGDSVTGELTAVVAEDERTGAKGDVCLRDGTSLVLDSFRLTSTAKTGLTMFAGNNTPPQAPRATLTNGVISGHEIGIAVLDDKAELSLDRVELQDNGTPLTSP